MLDVFLDIQCLIKKIACCGCKTPKEKVIIIQPGANLIIRNPFCCNYENTVRIELGRSCCSNPRAYLDMLRSCCTNFTRPSPTLKLAKSCCDNVNIGIRLATSCCQHYLVLGSKNFCCSIIKTEIENIETCCENGKSEVYLKVLDLCCEHLFPMSVLIQNSCCQNQIILSIQESCCDTEI